MSTLDKVHSSSRPVPNPKRSLITRLHMGTGVVVGVLFAAIAYYLLKNSVLTYTDKVADPLTPHDNNIVLLGTMFAWSIGFMVGIGAFIGPWRWLIGKDLTDEEILYMAGDGQGTKRYFKYCTDHKVVGIQYLVGFMTLLGQ